MFLKKIQVSALDSFLIVACCSVWVSFVDTIASLAQLHALQSTLVQPSVLPMMVSLSQDVRKASTDARMLLDSHFILC